jgi:probable rRNA maturation factor
VIEFFSEDIEFPQFDDALATIIINKIISDKDKVLDFVNIIFCSDEYLLKINQDYLSHDYYTDIITFPYSETEISSDIFISIERVLENAQTNSLPFNEELHRIIFHGILHLVGYDDKSDADKMKMTEMENYYLQTVL